MLERLLEQLYRCDPALRYEIIVVDEASSDRTSELLDRHASEHGVIVVRNDPPLRLPGARNAGEAVATGRYVAWIDDDDLTSPDRLARQVGELDRTGRRWSCAGRIDIDDDLRIVGHMRCPDEDGLLARLLAFNVLPTAAQGLVVDRRLAAEVGGYDRDLDAAEDWEYCIRLAAIETPLLIDEPLVGYRTGGPSMSTDTARMQQAIEQVLDKHADLRREHRVEPDRTAIHHSLLAADLGRSRVGAVRRAIAVMRATPSATAVARVGLIALAPDRFARRSAARRLAQVPPAWRAQARAWLDEVPG